MATCLGLLAHQTRALELRESSIGKGPPDCLPLAAVSHHQAVGFELGIKRRNMLRYGYGYTCLVHVWRVVMIGIAPSSI